MSLKIWGKQNGGQHNEVFVCKFSIVIQPIHIDKKNKGVRVFVNEGDDMVWLKWHKKC